MTKVKLRKVGNSIGVILPKELIEGYNIGDEIVITVGDDVITSCGVITVHEDKPDKYFRPKFNTEQCPKHLGSMKGTCGCN